MRLSGLIAVILTAAAVAGCDDDRRVWFQVVPSGERVVLDPLEEYRDPGVATRHHADHGLYVVTIRPGRDPLIFALASECPHDGDPIRFDRLSRRFACEHGDHRYTREGLPATPDYEGKGLPRVGVDQSDGRLVAYPGRRYLFEADQWSLPQTMVELTGEEGE